MFEGIKNLKKMGSMMQNAQGMQENIQQMQTEIDDQHFQTEFLEGNLKITMSGSLEVIKTQINPEYQSTVSNEQLQKDITFAFSDIIGRINKHKADKMQEMTMSMFGDMEGMDMEEMQKMMR
jgi:DNA-binding protein YbaB